LCIVDKSAVEASKGGRGTFVAPGVEPVEERELRDTELAERVIEGVAKPIVYVTRVLISSRAMQVEIPNKKPGTRDVLLQFEEVVKEHFGIAVIRGSIDICDTDVQVRKFRGKHSGERVLSNNIGLQ